MLIELTHKEQKIVERLGNAIKSGLVPVNEIGSFLDELQRKVDGSAATGKNVKKHSRKSKYMAKFNIAI